jgi:hypothetical protein
MLLNLKRSVARNGRRILMLPGQGSSTKEQTS